MINTGGREGHVEAPDGSMPLTITAPAPGKKEGTNPEQLFAAGYSSCFNSALELVKQEAGIDNESTVTAKVSLFKEGDSDFHIGVELTVHIDGVSAEETQKLAESAHQVCPYSKATRGNIEVDLKTD
ncbi:organic hydroperoxide resistance protein [Secundilactobacillus malefermentans DSM 5705 = KCTC 3548]|nr:organic hydroperoxide resistance protein [Secundilactobacillus malefermentans DSM 5705 = KCTC 3548]